MKKLLLLFLAIMTILTMGLSSCAKSKCHCTFQGPASELFAIDEDYYTHLCPQHTIYDGNVKITCWKELFWKPSNTTFLVLLVEPLCKTSYQQCYMRATFLSCSHFFVHNRLFNPNYPYFCPNKTERTIDRNKLT